MIVDKENVTIGELGKIVDQKTLDKIVDYALNKVGYFKCAELAVNEKVSRAAISLRVKGDKYYTVEYRGYLYAKKK